VLDVNGDHRIDLLTVETPVALPPQLDPQGTSSSPRYRLYIADAQRRYGSSIEISAGPQPYIADVDGDGADDFLLMNDIRPNGFRTVATEVTVLRSNGDGTFERLTPFRIAPDSQINLDRRILAGDLNHDGLPDLVIRATHDLVVLRGIGGGRFAVENRYMPMNMDFGWWSTRLADIDGDANPDVIVVGFRSIRVFFGDGRGNFPRTAKATIAKLHDAENIPAGLGELLNVDKMNQPRDLAIGHFTRSDRNQIAAGTGEGDLVVFSWEQGALKEVSRTRTEFWALDIRSADFHGTGSSDLYLMGTLIWGDVYPRPRVFESGADLAKGGAAVRSPGRSRAWRPAAPETALQAEVRGDCVDAGPQLWKFERDGAFGVARQGETTVEAVFDGPIMHYRLSAPYAKEPAEGFLAETDGSYSGTNTMLTSCGWKVVSITAKVQ